MKELDCKERQVGNNEMRTPAQPTCRYTPRYQRILTILLVIFCIPITFYHLVPLFTHATNNAVNSLASKLIQTSRGNQCTKDIGDATCCTLYLDAAPCQDECRKQYVDRETLSLTLAYDQCAEECLVSYNRACTHSTTPTDHETVHRPV